MRLLFDADPRFTGPALISPVRTTDAEGDDREDDFESACDSLVRLVIEHRHEQLATAGPDESRSALDEFFLAHALEYRHRGTADGRLALWREEHVRALLLEWLPRHVTVPPQEADDNDAPGAVAALVEFLAAAGILDPRSENPGRLRETAEELRAAHAEAMQDPRFMGPAKFWMLTAARSGVDIHSERSLDRFLSDARAGRVAYDEEQLEKVMLNRLSGGVMATGAGPGGRSLLQEREPALPAVALHDDSSLRRAAADAGVLGQLAEIARWLGKDGRPVTKTGRLKTADAIELARLLGTERGLGAAAGPLGHLAGDVLDGIRRADQLPYLRLLVEWAREARLVRVYGGRLVAVAGARAVREDPLALAARALTALPGLRDPLLTGPVWDVPSRLYPRFDLLLPDVLAALYGMPAATPWPLLWHTVRTSYLEDDDWFVTEDAADASDRHSAAELHAVFRLLAAAGMVDLTRGPVDTTITEPLRALATAGGPGAGRPEDAAPGRDLLSACEGDDVELVRLTPLGTYAVRALLTSLGRRAPALGDLRKADATALLASLLDEYGPDETRAELAGWIAAQGGWDAARPALAGALTRVRLHTRRNAMLRLLTMDLPDGLGPQLLRTLRDDAELAPNALLIAQERVAGQHTADPGDTTGSATLPAIKDMDERESALAVAESLLLMRELGGEDGLLAELGHSRGDAEMFTTMLRLACASGHPDRAGLERLARIDVTGLRSRAASWGRLRADAARKRKAAGNAKGKKRKKRR
ncbi:hypothetical protein AB0D14_39285 [Streptomyces sp. NPDC048484]|uniref:hypothetical protein n=1 Tax=Streptomyces sp. NPDC048484 TaxID=3155146 RepID=UPI00343C6238